MRVSEIRVKRIRVNQGLGVIGILVFAIFPHKKTIVLQIVPIQFERQP